MFDFEKLDLYQEIRNASSKLLKWVMYHPTMDDYFVERFKFIISSIAGKLAEGTARMSIAEKKKCYTDARVHVFECVTLLYTMKDMDSLGEEEYNEFYEDLDRISRMLLGMIRSQRKERDKERNQSSYSNDND